MLSKYPASIQIENGRLNVRYVMISPSRVPTSCSPNELLMFTKIKNNGSRNSTPGNICVDNTVVVNAVRPRNRKRDTANAARIAIATETTVADTATIVLFTEYRASGTVFHMSTNGASVRFDGHQLNAPCTSFSGFSDDVIITYSGTSTNRPSTVSTTPR